jgi:hypothetical protein
MVVVVMVGVGVDRLGRLYLRKERGMWLTMVDMMVCG